ncbi:hypothetical protein BD310DRAFT_957207 [Dichomitus squalens]|uniref:RBR-type E3 ubiquitin transferase n=1 Tax=Dichomitus squalens TaxID=114155 RepID=A0A4Q9Q1Q3_9APHY|nr:hypothetical protein BD310DRAFT_957207 [Dichomitus squalens]
MNRGQGRRSRRALEADQRIAMGLAIEEVRALDIFQGDRALALRLQDEEVRAFGDGLVRPQVGHERIAAEHRPMNLRPQRRVPPVLPRNRPRIDLGRMIRRLDVLGVARRMLSRVKVGTPSRRVLLNATASPVIRVRDSVSHRLSRHECITCMERIQGMAIRAPCGHYYDTGCMALLLDAAIRDESLFPPKCCQRLIPLASVLGHLSAEQRLTFEAKREEFSVQNRVYCAKPTCSRFLGAQQDRGRRSHASRRCPVPGCGTATCLRCRNEIKAGSKHYCSENDLDQSAIALAKDRGWARCPGCSNMVELSLGCYHMTCRCKTEFCYHCGARWKTCDCPQFEERELVTPPPAPARLRGEHRMPIRPPTPPRMLLVPVPEFFTPEQIRRERTLPLIPEPPRATRATRVHEDPTPSIARHRHRAFRIFPVPSSEQEDTTEEEPRRYVIVRVASRGPRPASSFAAGSEPNTPIAGPSTLNRGVSASVSSSDQSSDDFIPRYSLELR